MQNIYKCKIIEISEIAENVKRIKLEKPQNYAFQPGNATSVSLNVSGYEKIIKPLTFSGIPEWDFLEFTVKIYKERQGFTEQIGLLKTGDYLNLRAPYNSFIYKGPGVFISGGAGITPFLSIFRSLRENRNTDENLLIYSNKTKKEIICENELKDLIGSNNCIFTLTEEEKDKYEFGRISEDMIKKYVSDFNTNFYLCGPPLMVKDIKVVLNNLGAEPEYIEY